MADNTNPASSGAPQGFVPPMPPRTNAPLKTQPNFQPVPPLGGPMPSRGGSMPLQGGPAPAQSGPMLAQGGVPFTIICPEGYLPVVKFIKIPERTPREEGSGIGGASNKAKGVQGGN